MTHTSVSNLALLPVWVLVVGFAYAIIGTLTTRRMGREALLALWPAAAIAFTATSTLRIRAHQAGLGMATERQAGWPTAVIVFGVAIAMFGAASWVLRRPAKDARPSAAALTVVKSAFACLGGFIAAFVVIAILDVAGVPFRVV